MSRFILRLVCKGMTVFLNNPFSNCELYFGCEFLLILFSDLGFIFTVLMGFRPEGVVACSDESANRPARCRLKWASISSPGSGMGTKRLKLLAVAGP